MVPIRHILFPFDFSTPAQRAVPFVRAIAGPCQARVTVLSVVPPVWEAAPEFAMEDGDRQQELADRLNHSLHDEFRTLDVDRVAAAGDPATKIVEFAHESKVDLIMMPTHGMGLARSLLIGSVTAKVLHDVNCPVWTAHLDHDPAQTPHTVLCAIDATPRCVDLIRWTGAFCRQLGAESRLLHVVPPISDWLALPSERELQEQVRATAIEQVEQLRKEANVDGRVRVAVGKIAETVTEQAIEERAGLIVIGRGAAQARLGRLRTHVFGIVHKARCAVISV